MEKKDATELKQVLADLKKEGHRFVVHEESQEPLKKEHLIPFKTAYEAKEYAYENTTDYDRYVVRSVATMEKQVDKVLLEQGAKRSRDRDLER